METKIKEQIKGAVLASGIWIIILNVFPKIRELEVNLDSQILIGIALIAIGWFWIK